MKEYIEGIKDATGMTAEEIQTQIDANGFGEESHIGKNYEAGYEDGLAFMEIYA